MKPPLPPSEPVVPHQGVVARIYANLGLLLGGKAAAGLISLIYMVIAARVLGPKDYGVLVLINYFAMFVGGLIAFPGWHAIVRYGVVDAESDHDKLIRLLRFAGAIELAGGAAAVLTAALAAPLIGPRLGWSPQAQALAIPYSLAVLATVRATPAGFLQIIRRFDILGLHNTITPVMRLCGTLIVVAFGWGITGFILAWLVAALAECISLWVVGIYFAQRHFGDKALLGAVRDVRHENEGLGQFMVTANADIMLADLASRAVPLVMGWVLGPAAAGLYSIAHRTTIVISQPAQILGQAAYAELVRLAGTGNSGTAVRHALMKVVGIALAIALPVLICVTLFAGKIAVLTAGPQYNGAAKIMVLLAFARVIALVNPPISSALIALGKPRLSVAANLACNVGLLPLLPVLTSLYGLEGAGLHAIAQSLLGVAILGIFVWTATQSPAVRRS